jgi:hypothetical protein
MQEKNAWLEEKGKLNREILSRKTNVAQAITLAEREKQDAARAKDAELERRERRDTELKALRDEKPRREKFVT